MMFRDVRRSVRAVSSLTLTPAEAFDLVERLQHATLDAVDRVEKKGTEADETIELLEKAWKGDAPYDD